MTTSDKIKKKNLMWDCLRKWSNVNVDVIDWENKKMKNEQVKY